MFVASFILIPGFSVGLFIIYLMTKSKILRLSEETIIDLLAVCLISTYAGKLSVGSDGILLIHFHVFLF